jgi:hypothetical protein
MIETKISFKTQHFEDRASGLKTIKRTGKLEMDGDGEFTPDELHEAVSRFKSETASLAVPPGFYRHWAYYTVSGVRKQLEWLFEDSNVPPRPLPHYPIGRAKGD